MPQGIVQQRRRRFPFRRACSDTEEIGDGAQDYCWSNAEDGDFGGGTSFHRSPGTPVSIPVRLVILRQVDKLVVAERCRVPPGVADASHCSRTSAVKDVRNASPGHATKPLSIAVGNRCPDRSNRSIQIKQHGDWSAGLPTTSPISFTQVPFGQQVGHTPGPFPLVLMLLVMSSRRITVIVERGILADLFFSLDGQLGVVQVGRSRKSKVGPINDRASSRYRRPVSRSSPSDQPFWQRIAELDDSLTNATGSPG